MHFYAIHIRALFIDMFIGEGRAEKPIFINDREQCDVTGGFDDITRRILDAVRF